MQKGAEKVLYCLIKISSQKEWNGYRFDPAAIIGIIFGEQTEPYDSERVKGSFFTVSTNWRISSGACKLYKIP